MIIIGLTGGIGVGKSTVSAYLNKKKYHIIDADKMAHDLTKKGSSTLNDIRKNFGDEVFLENGELDRKKLAEVVFNDSTKKCLLEELTTKVVLKNIKYELKDLRASGLYDIIFLDVPLLFETGADRLVDYIWLVDADLDTRIHRVMERDDVSYEHVIARINNQMSSEEKKLKSNDIIDNSKGKEELYQQVELLLLKYDRTAKG